MVVRRPTGRAVVVRTVAISWRSSAARGRRRSVVQVVSGPSRRGSHGRRRPAFVTASLARHSAAVVAGPRQSSSRVGPRAVVIGPRQSLSARPAGSRYRPAAAAVVTDPARGRRQPAVVAGRPRSSRRRRRVGPLQTVVVGRGSRPSRPVSVGTDPGRGRPSLTVRVGRLVGAVVVGQRQSSAPRGRRRLPAAAWQSQ
jgi:hypothetical protein